MSCCEQNTVCIKVKSYGFIICPDGIKLSALGAVHGFVCKVNKLIGIPIPPADKSHALAEGLIGDLKRRAELNAVCLVAVVGILARLVPIEFLRIKILFGNCRLQNAAFLRRYRQIYAAERRSGS